MIGVLIQSNTLFGEWENKKKSVLKCVPQDNFLQLKLCLTVWINKWA